MPRRRQLRLRLPHGRFAQQGARQLQVRLRPRHVHCGPRRPDAAAAVAASAAATAAAVAAAAATTTTAAAAEKAAAEAQPAAAIAGEALVQNRRRGALCAGRTTLRRTGRRTTGHRSGRRTARPDGLCSRIQRRAGFCARPARAALCLQPLANAAGRRRRCRPRHRRPLLRRARRVRRIRLTTRHAIRLHPNLRECN
eukprot:4803309-Prymnesium_polylepis.1